MSDVTVWYVNVYVEDFDRALTFYTDKLGLDVRLKDDNFGYASFHTKGASFAIAKVNPDQMDMVGRHTGVGLAVEDLEGAHRALEAKGVEFTMPPTKQPWGGTLALFKDSEGNVLFLDQLRDLGAH